MVVEVMNIKNCAGAKLLNFTCEFWHKIIGRTPFKALICLASGSFGFVLDIFYRSFQLDVLSDGFVGLIAYSCYHQKYVCYPKHVNLNHAL